MIELKNISLRVPSGKKLLSEISWSIESNEPWVLFGPNGSGKTKLLEIITGYIYPSEGEVLRFQNMNEGDIRELRKEIGYVSSAIKDRFPRKEQVIDVVDRKSVV